MAELGISLQYVEIKLNCIEIEISLLFSVLMFSALRPKETLFMEMIEVTERAREREKNMGETRVENVQTLRS